MFVQTDCAVTIAEGIASVAVTQGSNPLEGVNVYVFTATGAYLGLRDTTAMDGIAEFRLPEGTYKFLRVPAKWTIRKIALTDSTVRYCKTG